MQLYQLLRLSPLISGNEMVTKNPSVSPALLPMVERGVLIVAKVLNFRLKNKTVGSF